MGLGGGSILRLFLEESRAIRRNGPVPAEMPLADACGAVACCFARVPIVIRSGAMSGAPQRPTMPPAVSSSNGSGRSAGCIAKANTHPTRMPVVVKRIPSAARRSRVGRGDPAAVGIVAADITVAEVVGIEDEEVWVFRGGLRHGGGFSSGGEQDNGGQWAVHGLWKGTAACCNRLRSEATSTRCTGTPSRFAIAAAVPAASPSIIQVGSTRSELKATREALVAQVTRRLSHSRVWA